MKEFIRNYLYFAEFSENKKRNTILSLEKDLRQFREYLEKYEKLEKISDITNYMIRSFLVFLQENKVTSRSANRKLSSLRMFFKYLVKERIIYQNPAETIAFPEFIPETPVFLTPDEINLIRDVINIKTPNGLRDRLMIEILYSSGITMTEMLSLGESVFDLDKRELYVGLGKHMRIVFFSVRTREFFIRYVEAKKRKYKEKYNKDILFVNGSGTRLSDRSLRRIIKKYAVRANINKEVSPFTFRHSFAKYMLKNGMDIYYLKELLGHLEIESTKYYLEFL